MPRFETTFVLYKDDVKQPSPPPREFSTESTTRVEFWQALRQVEDEVSQEHEGKAQHLFVTLLEDIPELGLRRDAIIAYNDLELS